MDYEKAYLEAVKRAKAGKPMDEVFPELKESEDERIRKEIVELIEKNYGCLRSIRDKELALAYLEKQKEQKIIIVIPKFRKDDIVISTKNNHLTYQILNVGSINELGNPEYEVEIFTDGKADNPRNIHSIEITKMDEWGKLIEHKRKEPGYKHEDYFCEKCQANAFNTGRESVQKEQKLNIELIQRSWYLEGYYDRKFGKEPKWIIKTGEDGPEYEENPKYGQMFKEQKPSEWNEEDNRRLNAIIFELKQTNHMIDWYTPTFLIDWLKSLRPQSKQEWNEEDEKIVRFYEADYNNQIGDMSMKDVIDMRLKFKNWLTNRLKLLRPQPKQEWSEEDKLLIDTAIYWLERRLKIDKALDISTPSCPLSIRETIERLKSLHPQPHWKPSEEQMEALRYWCDATKNKLLIALYNDLKKL